MLEALEVPDPEMGAAQVAAMIGGLTIDAVTPHGGLSIERLREILRAHLRMLLTAERRR